MVKESFWGFEDIGSHFRRCEGGEEENAELT